jgi:hypothetical protein
MVSCVLVGLVSCGPAESAPKASGAITVDARPVQLDSRDVKSKQIGKLLFMAGFSLTSSDAGFGGLSGLVVGSDGTMLVAVSDRGYWLSARMRHDPDGRLTGLSQWEKEPMLAADKRAVRGRWTDAEALAQDSDGSFVVSLEQIHRLWRYPPVPATFRSVPRPLSVPAELVRAPANGGVECVAAVGDGRLVILTEDLRRPDGSLAGWIIDNHRFDEISYTSTEGFTPSDCAILRNGDLLILERRLAGLEGWAARIRRVLKEALRSGARIDAIEIARIERPLAVDNFEGMAVHDHPGAGTFVYLVSDDNYFFLQRTLLLQFKLIP